MRAFIIFRDRVTYGRLCFKAMQDAGLEVFIVDHGTTWPEAVEWLVELKKSGIQVIDDYGHPRDLWERPWFRAICASEQYVVTDPDVVPSEGCPLDWPQRLSELLRKYPTYHKVGLGLRIDNLPLHYQKRGDAIGWESHFWDTPVEDNVFHADVDTTLAVHLPTMEMGAHSFRALRTGFPYVADHLAWHEDLDNLSPEMQYYHEHAERGMCSWTLPGRGASEQISS
jgi:hypothetical protein